MRVPQKQPFPAVRPVVVILGAGMLAWLLTFTASVTTHATIMNHSSFAPPSSSRTTQLSGSLIAFGQNNVFVSYPTCSPVQLISVAGWRTVSFDRLSIRVPNGLELQQDYGSDHGGRGWKARDTAVGIDRSIGMRVEPYRPAASLAYRECTTTLGNLFALIQEYGVNGRYGTSVLFPEVQLVLHISRARAESLAFSRTIVSTARATTRKVQ
jgi:hypothetical protein